MAEIRMIECFYCGWYDGNLKHIEKTKSDLFYFHCPECGSSTWVTYFERWSPVSEPGAGYGIQLSRSEIMLTPYFMPHREAFLISDEHNKAMKKLREFHENPEMLEVE